MLCEKRFGAYHCLMEELSAEGGIVQIVIQAPSLVRDISHILTQDMLTLQRPFHTFLSI